jgi:hypothetical protein
MGSTSTPKLPNYKTLLATSEELTEVTTQLARASTGKKPLMRIPAPVVTAMKGLPRIQTWIENNRTAYESFVTASAEKSRAAGS